MTSLNQLKNTKVHNRNLRISTFDCKIGGIIVEGELTDKRLVETYHYSGDLRPPSLVHHLIIRLRVDEDLTIQDVEVEMPGIPHAECSETRDSIKQIKGLTIKRGFTMKIKEIFCQGQGCAHLTELLIAMAPAAIQGFFTALATEPFSPEMGPPMEQFLSDTCWFWRKDGPAIKRLNDLANDV